MAIRDSRDTRSTFRPYFDTPSVLRQQVRLSHTRLNEGAAPGLLNRDSSPRSIALVGLYLHAVCVEDVTVQSVLRNEIPLFTSLWSEPTSHADSGPLREYAAAVHASTNAYLGQLSSDELSRVLDLDSLGLGRRTVAWVINRFVIAELAHICGEISDGAAPSVHHSIDHGLPDAGRRGALRHGRRRLTLGRTQR